MPQATGSPGSRDAGELGEAAAPSRPQASSREASALETVAAAGKSLSEKTVETASTAHTEILAARERAAEAEAARKEREAKRWVMPLSDYRVTAGFGQSSSLWSSYHTGLDLATDYGSSVMALSSGTIIEASYEGAYGYRVIVEHWDGTQTWYCHLSRFIQTSGTVTPGTVVGEVGTSGNSTGPHLHLEVHPGGGDAVNPASWLAEQGLAV